MQASSWGTDRPVAVCGLVLLMALVLGGCRSGVPMRVDGAYQPPPPEGVNFGEFEQTPRVRLGGLPYPGAFTLFELADPDNLGHHFYNDHFGVFEAYRGILYTRQGGFIDMAHVRKSVDLCKYVAVRAEFALMHDWAAFRVKSLEPSVFTIRLDYPAFWKDIPPDQKRRLARELSIRIGQRTAMAMVTWHELLTWFGYQSTPVIPEWQSAFTWDDTGGHAFGVMVGGRALRDGDREWNQAVTDEITRALREQGVVTRDQAWVAVNQIQGVWWRGFDPLKRQIETGLDGRAIVAWLVRDLPSAKDAVPYRYELPGFDDVMGYDFRHLVHIEIQPNVWETDRIRSVVPGKPSEIDLDKHLPIIIEHMRQWHVRHEGEQALRPY